MKDVNLLKDKIKELNKENEELKLKVDNSTKSIDSLLKSLRFHVIKRACVGIQISQFPIKKIKLCDGKYYLIITRGVEARDAYNFYVIEGSEKVVFENFSDNDRKLLHAGVKTYFPGVLSRDVIDKIIDTVIESKSTYRVPILRDVVLSGLINHETANCGALNVYSILDKGIDDRGAFETLCAILGDSEKVMAILNDTSSGEASRLAKKAMTFVKDSNSGDVCSIIEEFISGQFLVEDVPVLSETVPVKNPNSGNMIKAITFSLNLSHEDDDIYDEDDY